LAEVILFPDQRWRQLAVVSAMQAQSLTSHRKLAHFIYPAARAWVWHLPARACVCVCVRGVAEEGGRKYKMNT